MSLGPKFAVILGACKAVSVSRMLPDSLVPDTIVATTFAQIRGELKCEPVDITLAQTAAKATQEKKTCLTTAERAREPVEDYYAIYNGDEWYQDEEFPPEESSLYWDEFNEQNMEHFEEEGYYWHQAGIQFKDHDLFGETISANSVKENALDENWWMLSAVSQVAEEPDRVKRLFLEEEDEYSSTNIYAIQLQALGLPHTVLIDDSLPLSQEMSSYTWRTGYTKINLDSSIWFALLEKAYAKYLGNYNHLKNGKQTEALQTLTGYPVERHFIDSSFTVNMLWNTIREHESNDDIIVAVMPLEPEEDSEL